MGGWFLIAIDFGTAYSGYAFCVSSENSEPRPRVPKWGQEHGFNSPKTPTCILFDEHEEFKKFGYDAKMAYTKMHGADAQKHYLFENFKMELYGKTINKNLMIKAHNGKSMSALKIIAETLRYLKDHALKTIGDHTSGRQFIASDVTWVLTVPAIWDAAAKQFMREAATAAGLVTDLNSDSLILALEPEAASVWCKKLPSDGFIAEEINEDTLEQTPGTKYMVVDCGGGTIDITVHEVLQGGTLKELHKASGNDMGGGTVDKNLKMFLREIFSDELWDDYEKYYAPELQKLMYAFSLLKGTDDDIDISCPYNFRELAKKYHSEMSDFFKTSQGASWEEGSIKITKERMRSFFDDSFKGITESIRQILNSESKDNPEGLSIDFILLVGGYASCNTLRSHIKQQFSGQCKVLFPTDPQEVIIKGAVLFGKNPKVVSSRVSALTYGITVYQRFDESKHKPEKKFTTHEGIEYCSDVFNKLVQKGESVGCDEVRKHTFFPISSDQTEISFRFFSTERLNAKYVDEWGMDQIGSFTVQSPDTTKGLDRSIRLEIKFGFTEMQATATDIESKQTQSIKLDFLRN
ncbi:heat shock 70 kDa protein 12A-like [Oncorhynchus clarkii lewisi]|uniref:heat shock 70 kDa protein 12A-like n=1 Tax=Oncorhynchus clarkii lewisi TaxID=490388 RepID=UPI0039B91FEC